MGLKGYRLWAMGQLDSTCRAPPCNARSCCCCCCDDSDGATRLPPPLITPRATVACAARARPVVCGASTSNPPAPAPAPATPATPAPHTGALSRSTRRRFCSGDIGGAGCCCCGRCRCCCCCCCCCCCHDIPRKPPNTPPTAAPPPGVDGCALTSRSSGSEENIRFMLRMNRSAGFCRWK